MTRKSIVRAACVIAAAFAFIAAPTFAGPAAATAEQGAEAGKPLKLTKSSPPKAKTSSRVRKAKVAHRGGKAKLTASKAKPEQASSRKLSPEIADAKAEMASADARGAAEVSVSEPSSPPATQAFEGEQINTPERIADATDTDQPRAIQTQLVTADQPQVALPIVAPEKSRTVSQAAGSSQPQASVTAVSGDAWAQSSLIGKIFIAFGGMLTLASAARMLIA